METSAGGRTGGRQYGARRSTTRASPHPLPRVRQPTPVRTKSRVKSAPLAGHERGRGQRRIAGGRRLDGGLPQLTVLPSPSGGGGGGAQFTF